MIRDDLVASAVSTVISFVQASKADFNLDNL
jgi:hypothetical protein